MTIPWKEPNVANVTVFVQAFGDLIATLRESNDCPLAGRRLNGSMQTEAHLAYLKGRYLWNRRTESDLFASLEEFQRALAFEPDFALGHTGVADACILLGSGEFCPHTRPSEWPVTRPSALSS